MNRDSQITGQKILFIAATAIAGCALTMVDGYKHCCTDIAAAGYFMTTSSIVGMICTGWIMIRANVDTDIDPDLRSDTSRAEGA